MDWMKVTVLTTTLGSDMVSEALIEAGSAGTVIEDKNDVALNQRPEGQWDIIDEEIARRIGDDVKVSGFYPMDERASDALASLKQKVAGLKELAPGVELGKLEVLVDGVDDEDWAENWKKSYKPFRLGKHIVIKPGWEEYSPEPDDKIITIDPGMAFGTGTHETTGMCVGLIEQYARPGCTCMDIGTGTGILAITAALMGVKHVLASDIDPMAVKVAKENVAINGFSDTIDCVCGDLLDIANEPVDLVSANIIADVIINICAPVRRFIKPGGIFICSGIARERQDETIAALNRAG
ncbi:MAG: 50S ribosomal protein L11 methyltransferase, partial [Clostridia bacterium]|nr:50S ribosomal protein L11 methyltransferase [Clostridia bacterium]